MRLAFWTTCYTQVLVSELSATWELNEVEIYETNLFYYVS